MAQATGYPRSGWMAFGLFRLGFQPQISGAILAGYSTTMKYRPSLKEGYSVGLEITPVILRAVEIKIHGRETTIQRLASAAMPAGSVVRGRIVDPAGVAGALRQLWEHGRFSTRRCAL